MKIARLSSLTAVVMLAATVACNRPGPVPDEGPLAVTKGKVHVTVLCPGPVETEFMARAGVPKGYFPKMLSRSAERVAAEGYEGLMAGKRVVVPGSDNKVLSFLPRLLPRGWVLSLTKGGKI